MIDWAQAISNKSNWIELKNGTGNVVWVELDSTYLHMQIWAEHVLEYLIFHQPIVQLLIQVLRLVDVFWVDQFIEEVNVVWNLSDSCQSHSQGGAEEVLKRHVKPILVKGYMSVNWILYGGPNEFWKCLKFSELAFNRYRYGRIVTVTKAETWN